MPRKANTPIVDIKDAYDKMIEHLQAKQIKIWTINFTAVNALLDAFGYDRQPWPRDSLPFGTGINEPCDRILVPGSCQVGQRFIRISDNTAWKVVFYQTEKRSPLIGGDTVYWIAVKIAPNKNIRIKSKTPKALATMTQIVHLREAVDTSNNFIKGELN